MKGGVLALGNFDGVHKGHQAVIKAAVDIAREKDVSSRVLTFEPHPRTFFQPNSVPFRLTPPDVKERLLIRCGINDIIRLPFTADLAQMPAEMFVEKVLLERYGAEHVVAGHDFVFGQNRDGNMEKLKAFLKPCGVDVTEIEEKGDDGESYSSTRVRELLLEGDVEAATKILGRPWSLEGPVVRGSTIGGKTLGFPTANLCLGPYLRPKFGVYTIRAGKIGGDLPILGVANIGQRPTVDGKKEILERSSQLKTELHRASQEILEVRKEILAMNSSVDKKLEALNQMSISFWNKEREMQADVGIDTLAMSNVVGPKVFKYA